MLYTRHKQLFLTVLFLTKIAAEISAASQRSILNRNRLYAKTPDVLKSDLKNEREDDFDLDYYVNVNSADIDSQHGRSHNKDKLNDYENLENLKQDIISVFQLIQKNYDAKYRHDIMEKRNKVRKYFVANPEIFQHIKHIPVGKPNIFYSDELLSNEFVDLTRDLEE